MFPYFTVFGFQLSAYGLLVVLGFTGLVLVARARASRLGLEKQDVFFMLLYAMIGMIIGAKLLYQLPRMGEIWQYRSVIFSNADTAVQYFSAGFVFYGGLLGGLFGAYLYARQFKLKLMPLLEAAVPGIPLAHCLGRIGCLLAGCCYGMPVDAHWGVQFNRSVAAPHDVYLLPVQGIEAGINLLLFGALVVYTRKPRPSGRVLGLYLLCYAFMRFGLEFLRYDDARGAFMGISTSQWISLILLPFAIYLIIYYFPRSGPDTEKTPDKPAPEGM